MPVCQRSAVNLLINSVRIPLPKLQQHGFNAKGRCWHFRRRYFRKLTALVCCSKEIFGARDMVRSFVLAGVLFVSTLFTAQLASVSAYSCRNGRSTDPNCYRDGGYVCGRCYDDRGGRRGDRGEPYTCRDGRSTDPNCYRNGNYVCGPCYGWGGRRAERCDGRGRSADPNCYRGKRQVYVCGPCWD